MAENDRRAPAAEHAPLVKAAVQTPGHSRSCLTFTFFSRVPVPELPCQPRQFGAGTGSGTGTFTGVRCELQRIERPTRGARLLLVSCGRSRAFPHPPPPGVSQPELVPPQISHPGVAADGTLTSHSGRGRNER